MFNKSIQNLSLFEDSIGYDDKTFGKLFKEKDHKNDLKPKDII
ncbi:hypothetical protein [Staphylococcus aureus]|nr:hypothetical protein [Staphylococcus aureus]